MYNACNIEGYKPPQAEKICLVF